MKLRNYKTASEDSYCMSGEFYHTWYLVPGYQYRHSVFLLYRCLLADPAVIDQLFLIINFIILSYVM